MPISTSALVMTTVHQFQKLRLFFCMVFNQEFEFCSQNFITSLLRNSIFLHSEALLSSIMQNWKKSLSFHDCIPFDSLLLNLHTHNYHTMAHCKKFEIITLPQKSIRTIAVFDPVFWRSKSNYAQSTYAIENMY